MKNVMFAIAVAFSVLSISPLFATVSAPSSTLDLKEVFLSCPIIYSILLLLSVAACVIWLYSIFTVTAKTIMPPEFLDQVRHQLRDGHFEAALEICRREHNHAAEIVSSGIAARRHGPQVVMDAMLAEGRRAGNMLWQRLSLLNEITVIAPMLGLLGTVLGLFFAFYDSNRSAESIASIFDGLGVAIGTTVVGLIVAILAMVLQTTLRYRIVNVLNALETESLALVSLIDADVTT